MGSSAATDLRSVLARSGPMPPERAVDIVRQVAAALDDAHANQAIHRDITPATILVAGNDHVRLADTRTALAATTDSAALPYLAPELLANTAVTYRADIYALTGVLYECLTGVPPYPVTGNPPELIDRHLTGPIPRPSHELRRLPPGFDDVVATGLAKNPADRYRTPAELVRAAEHALAGRPPAYAGYPAGGNGPTVSFPHSGPLPLPRPKRRRRAVIAVTLAAALAAAAGAVVVPRLIGHTAPAAPATRSYADTPAELPFGELHGPKSVAVDHAGNVYVVDTDSGEGRAPTSRLLKLTPGATAPTAVDIPGLTVAGTTRVVFDATGNLYVTADGGVWELAVGTVRPIRLPFGVVSDPKGVAVDRAGNVYTATSVLATERAADSRATSVMLKLTPGSAEPIQLPFPDLGGVDSLAVDPAGNVYVSDSVQTDDGKYRYRVLKLPDGGTVPTELPLAVSFADLAVDERGNLFAVDGYGGPVLELPAGETTSITLPLDTRRSNSVAVNESGDLYVSVLGIRKDAGGPLVESPQVLKLSTDS